MKNLALALFSAIIVAACSSGNTISDVPQNVTSTFQGSFNDGGMTGSITLNLNDNNAGVVTGNIIVSGNTCLQNGSFTSGVSNGFNLTINDIPQAGAAGPDMFEVVTTTTGPSTTVTNADGTTTTEPGAVSISTVIQSTGTPGTQQTTQADGTVVETVTTLIAGDDAVMGTLNLQLAISNAVSYTHVTLPTILLV